jgi:hypothetical protein
LTGRIKPGAIPEERIGSHSSQSHPVNNLSAYCQFLFLGIADSNPHFADGAFQTHEDSARDNAVADVEFRDLFDVGDGADVSIGESVPGGDAQAVLRTERSRLS